MAKAGTKKKKTTNKKATTKGKSKGKASTAAAPAPAPAPASAADWLVLRAKYLKGSARYAPALFYAADELLREGRKDEATKLAEQFRELIDDTRAPNERTRRALLAGYLDERLGAAPLAANAKRLASAGSEGGREPVLAASGFPYQVTKFGGTESYIPVDVWRGLAPVLRFMKSGEHDRLSEAVDAAVRALPRREPDMDEFKDKAIAWAAGYVLVAAGLTKKANAAAEVNKFYGKDIKAPFQLAYQLAVGNTAEAKKLALSAAREAVAEQEVDDVILPCVTVAMAMGAADVTTSILKLASDATHKDKGAGPYVNGPLHAMLAAYWAQAGDAAAAERDLKAANTIAKRSKDRNFAQSMQTMIVNALAKLKRRDEAVEAAGTISSRDVKAAVLATLFVEFGEPGAAMEIVAKQTKKDVAAELCALCAANVHESELFYVLAPQS